MISAKIDHLAWLEKKIEDHQKTVNESRKSMQAEMDQMILGVLTDEQRRFFNDVKIEFSEKIAALEDDSVLKTMKAEAQSLEVEIREETIKIGSTTKGIESAYSCVYTPAKEEEKVNVNIDALKGMAVLMPKLKEIYTVEIKKTPAGTSLRRK